MNNSQKYFFKLLSSVINDTEILPPSENVDMRAVFDLGYNHKMLHTIYEKAYNYGVIKETDKNFKVWKNQYILYKTRDTRQQIAKDEIIDVLTENGIRVMPLKGLLIKDLYPNTYLRQMTDLDILIDKDNKSKVKSLLKSIGYKEFEGGKKHFSMVKKPAINLEIHLKIFENYWNECFSDVWENAEEKSKNLYIMSNEDLILHNIMHSAEHLLSAGIGIRAITDLYVLKKAYPEVLISENFLSKLDNYGLTDFFNVINNICQVWFEGKDDSSLNKMAEKFLLLSNNFGTNKDVAVQYASDIADSEDSRFMIFLKLFFPSYKNMCKRFKILESIKILLPVFWLVRIVRIPFMSGTMAVVKRLAKIDSEKIKERNELLKSFGLSETTNNS